MITLVIVLNLLIALLCLLGAWSFLQLRRSLADITFTLTEAERNTHEVLYGAPENIRNGQLGLYELLNRFVESLGDHGYGREINVSRERATDKIKLMSCGGTKYRYLT